MTPEQLEAHRMRFEHRYAYIHGWQAHAVTTKRDGDTYTLLALETAWQLYQWVLADADRAQRAAPGVQEGETWHEKADRLKKCVDYSPIGLDLMNHREALSAHLHEQPLYTATQPPQQSAQPGGEAVKLVDALLLEAEIFWWNDGPEGKSSDAMKAARDQVIVALSAAAQPVEVPSDFHTHKNAWRSALEMAEQNALVNPPDLDDKSYWRHEIAAFDRAYSELGAQPVEVQRVPLTAAEIEAIAKPFICTVGGYSQNEPAIPDNGKIEDFVQAVEAAHQIGVKK